MPGHEVMTALPQQQHDGFVVDRLIEEGDEEKILRAVPDAGGVICLGDSVAAESQAQDVPPAEDVQQQSGCAAEGFESACERASSSFPERFDDAREPKKMIPQKGTLLGKAFRKYAVENDMDENDVSLNLIEVAGGIYEWAYKGEDLTSAGSLEKTRDGKQEGCVRQLTASVAEEISKGLGCQERLGVVCGDEDERALR